MQHVLILKRLLPEYDEHNFLLGMSALTHTGELVRFAADQTQSINVLTLSLQKAPLVLLVDQLEYLDLNTLRIPADALMAVVPVAADEVPTFWTAAMPIR